MGNPDAEKVSTSYIEWQSLSMRMGMRYFTRLTNGFSKKAENPLVCDQPVLPILQLLQTARDADQGKRGGPPPQQWGLESPTTSGRSWKSWRR